MWGEKDGSGLSECFAKTRNGMGGSSFNSFVHAGPEAWKGREPIAPPSKKYIYIYIYLYIYIYIYICYPPPPRDLPFGCLSSACFAHLGLGGTISQLGPGPNETRTQYLSSGTGTKLGLDDPPQILAKK